ncbi:MAG TPA: hypothetical protein P5532_12810 [Planctomycetota bacterium]|nr:hypothetical protein [Planctomycetota bacterium]HRT95301.1 hypothetical protein [Planctomycetota bacterium]
MNGLRHGIFAHRILNAAEQQEYDAVVARLQKDFALNDSSDAIAVEVMAVALIRYARAMKDGNDDGAEKLDRIVRSHLKDLKATKIVREGETPSISTTPAEWAAALLEEVKATRKAGRKGKARAKADDGKASNADGTQKEPQI